MYSVSSRYCNVVSMIEFRVSVISMTEYVTKTKFARRSENGCERIYGFPKIAFTQTFIHPVSL